MSSQQLAAVARSMIVARRSLHERLPPELIADPVLDLLLTAYIADVEGVRLSAADLVQAHPTEIGAHPRWVAVLMQYGLISQSREAEFAITSHGREVMSETLRAVVRDQANLAR